MTKPNQVAAKHKATLKNIFKAARVNSPDSSRDKVSREKVEKVVNAPKKPIMITPRHSADNTLRSKIKVKNKPINKEPSTLTVKVP